MHITAYSKALPSNRGLIVVLDLSISTIKPLAKGHGASKLPDDVIDPEPTAHQVAWVDPKAIYTLHAIG